MRRARIRADPVSCQSCRSKKLKCNRVQPCTNCLARGITCDFLVPPPSSTSQCSTTHTNAELLERIERLESIIREKPIHGENLLEHTLSGNLAGGEKSLHPNTHGTLTLNAYEKQETDSRTLENVATREDSLLSPLSNDLVFEVRDTDDILQSQPNLQPPASNFSGVQLKDTVVIFPVYRVAALLFDSYQSNVVHLCCILHIPTARSLIKTFYLRISQGEPVLPSQAALLLSIFAIAAYFFQAFELSEVATTKQNAIRLSKILSRGALDVLDYSRRNTSGTLEDVQAAILMSFVTYHLDGFSARGRRLFADAVSISRELRLHRLDADEPWADGKENDFRLLVEREVKRRVFWHIASTDWLLSTISGPQEGMYFIHPNHIDVCFPKDCGDNDLILGEANAPVSGPQPTCMTFFLARLRLAHVCREIVDTVPMETSKLKELPYERVIALDGKLQDFMTDLPFFVKLDAESRKKTKPLETLYPFLPVARYCITTEAHSRRCKLHQRFLLRQSADARYAYSRRACLESARAVVQVYIDLRQHDTPSNIPELMGVCVHYTHLALVVMVMDLCFNKNEADEVEIKAEVKAALQMFDDTRNLSPLLGCFLSSLSEVLLKHKVQLTDPLNSANNAYTGNDLIGPAPHDTIATNNPTYYAQLGLEMQDPGVILDNSFDDFWQTIMEGEPNPDSLTWDNLFSAIDSRPL